MKKLWQRFTSSYILWGQAACCVILFSLHLYQFFDSGFRWESGIRVVFYPVYALSIFFFGQKLMFIELLGFSLAYAQTIRFDNYSAFLLLVVCCVMKNNRKTYCIPLFLLYAADILVVCMRNGKTPVHLIIHYCVCACIFVGIQIFIFFIKQKKNLDLTEEEQHILYHIVFEKKKLKEIIGYKQNTISKKLKKCREKNGLKDNDELYRLFEAEYSEI